MQHECISVQFKEGRNYEEYLEAQDAAARAAAEAKQRSGKDSEKHLLLLRLWGLLMAVTHRLFGVHFGGDVAKLVAQWQASLDHGAPTVRCIDTTEQ